MLLTPWRTPANAACGSNNKNYVVHTVPVYDRVAVQGYGGLGAQEEAYHAA